MQPVGCSIFLNKPNIIKMLQMVIRCFCFAVLVQLYSYVSQQCWASSRYFCSFALFVLSSWHRVQPWPQPWPPTVLRYFSVTETNLNVSGPAVVWSSHKWASGIHQLRFASYPYPFRMTSDHVPSAKNFKASRRSFPNQTRNAVWAWSHCAEKKGQ